MSHHKQVTAMYFFGVVLFFCICVAARHAEWIRSELLRDFMPLLALPLALLWPPIFVVWFVAMVVEAIRSDFYMRRERKQQANSAEQPAEQVPKQTPPDGAESSETSCAS